MTSGNIQITRESRFTNVISKLFPQTRLRGIEAFYGNVGRTTRCDKMTGRLNYALGKPSAFSTLKTLQEAITQSKIKKTKHGEIMVW
jgi:hypothetical protein